MNGSDSSNYPGRSGMAVRLGHRTKRRTPMTTMIPISAASSRSGRAVEPASLKDVTVVVEEPVTVMVMVTVEVMVNVALSRMVPFRYVRG